MTNDIIITRKLIPEGQRLSHTADLFGTHFPLQLEPVIYGITERMAKDYCGGYWLFYTLDNGGLYMAPDGEHVFAVSCANYYTGELSGDALGIVACLYAYSHLSFAGSGTFPRQSAQHYHLLRHFMYEHPEVANILSATD